MCIDSSHCFKNTGSTEHGHDVQDLFKSSGKISKFGKGAGVETGDRWKRKDKSLNFLSELPCFFYVALFLGVGWHL